MGAFASAVEDIWVKGAFGDALDPNEGAGGPEGNAKFGECIAHVPGQIIGSLECAWPADPAACDGGGPFAMEALIDRADRRTRRFLDTLTLEHVAPGLRRVREPASKMKRSCRGGGRRLVQVEHVHPATEGPSLQRHRRQRGERGVCLGGQLAGGVGAGGTFGPEAGLREVPPADAARMMRRRCG